MTDEQIIRERLGELRDMVDGLPAWEWSPIGDANLATWEWARKLEKRFGVDHELALRIAYAEVRPPRDEVMA